MGRIHHHSADSPSDEAIEWLARLRADDVTAAETTDFATWLAASTLNKIAFDEATELWQLSGQIPRQSVPRPEKPARQEWRYRRILPLAAAATLLFACFIMVLQLTTPSFATGKGEQRRVVLADGSIAFLNTASEISVNFSNDTRNIEVQQGEVWFDVIKQPQRPFVVTGRYASARAIGTAFTVRETPGFTRVGVTEGVVAVSSTDTDGVSLAQPHLLNSGQQSTVSADVTDFQTYDGATALAWQRGQLIYRDVRLDELLADLNRYSAKTMTINDDDLVARRVSVALFLEDQDAMLEALGSALPIRWKSVSDGLIIITSVD